MEIIFSSLSYYLRKICVCLVGRNTCPQAWLPDFSPWISQGRRRKRTHKSCSASTLTPWHVHICTHTCAHVQTENRQNEKRKETSLWTKKCYSKGSIFSYHILPSVVIIFWLSILGNLECVGQNKEGNTLSCNQASITESKMETAFVPTNQSSMLRKLIYFVIIQRKGQLKQTAGYSSW